MFVAEWVRIVCHMSCPNMKKFMKNSADLACRVRSLPENIFGVLLRIYKRPSTRQITKYGAPSVICDFGKRGIHEECGSRSIFH